MGIFFIYNIFLYICFMYNVPLTYILVGYWTLSVLYCLRWHYRKGNLNYGTTFISFLIAPAIVFILMQHDVEEKKSRKKLQQIDAENALRRYDEAIRNRITPSEVRAEWRRQNGIIKIRDFKFFR